MPYYMAPYYGAFFSVRIRGKTLEYKGRIRGVYIRKQSETARLAKCSVNTMCSLACSGSRINLFDINSQQIRYEYRQLMFQKVKAHKNQQEDRVDYSSLRRENCSRENERLIEEYRPIYETTKVETRGIRRSIDSMSMIISNFDRVQYFGHSRLSSNSCGRFSTSLLHQEVTELRS